MIILCAFRSQQSLLYLERFLHILGDVLEEGSNKLSSLEASLSQSFVPYMILSR